MNTVYFQNLHNVIENPNRVNTTKTKVSEKKHLVAGVHKEGVT